MDLLASYSDSDDATEKHEFSNGVFSEAVEPSKCLHNIDYFNLCYTSSDDECEGCNNNNQNAVEAMALILSDKPYKPDRQMSDHPNPDKNLRQNENVSLNYVKYPKRAIYEEDIIDGENETAGDNIMCDSLAVKHVGKSLCKIDPDSQSKTETICISSDYDTSTIPNNSNKKQKTDYDKTKNYMSYDNLSNNNSSVQSAYSNMENSLDSTVKKALSFSICEKAENCNLKLLPSGLPRKKIKTFNNHSEAVSALRWCVPNYSHLLLSGSLDCSLKVWNILSKKMVQDIKISTSGIKAAQWMHSGTAIICGGFDKKVHIFDIMCNKEIMTYNFPSYVSSVEMHPTSHHLFVAGIKDKILTFDTRNNLSEPIRKFESRCGQILDIKFLEDGNEFVCSTDIVSGDSADRTIMAWHFTSGAQLSNQIFHERYTCPFLQVEPNYRNFVAQTNGNYIAIFSTQRPYKMNKNKRYEGHKVLGYPVDCDFSANGKFLASGDAEGGLYIYWNRTAHLIKRQDVKPGVPTTQVKWHPDLHATMATSSWDGEVQLWQ